MGTIVAIGGGEFRKGGTRKIDEYIVKLSESTHPSLLFIPTASKDAENYIGSMKGYFGEMGCSVESLCLVTKKNTRDEIKKRILDADIIYVGGGNITYMMDIWKKRKINQYLKQAFEKGVILSGLSAGSICWFQSGYSDSNISGEEGIFRWCNGLDLLPFFHCPHYDEPNRKSFDSVMEKMSGEGMIGIALEKGVAISYIDGEYQIIKDNDKRSGYLIYKKNGALIKKNILDGTILNEILGNKH